jgi:hypothetical protein
MKEKVLLKMAREKYELTYDELYILIVGSLCLQIGDENVTPVTTLMIKNFVRESRNANITQKEVSDAVSKFYNEWTAAGSLLDVNGKVYDLKFKISEDGTHKEYYLEEWLYGFEDNESDSVKIKNIIKENMDLSSNEILAIINTLIAINKLTLEELPSVKSIAAYKANITRKRWNQ